MSCSMDLKMKIELKAVLEGCEVPTKVIGIIGDVLMELDRADAKYTDDRMVEPIVGLTTIKCELLELERECLRHPELRRPKDMRKEAVQVAAMAIKFLLDICK